MASKSERERQKQIQDKCQAILGQLLREEDNKYCVDCDAKGPRWASWNLGMFLCIRCAGIHRNLGVHISRVKSVNLDTWTPEQVACLQQMGNSKGRAVYEANLPDNFRRPQTDSSLEAFIRSKYEHKKYIAKEWVPPPMPPPAFDIEEDRRKEKDKKRPKQKTSNTDIPVPAPAGGKVALPRPQGNATPVPSSITNSAAASQNTADLLGLDVGSSGTADLAQPADDPFDEFLSAAPLTTTSATIPVTGASDASSTAEEKAFFGQTTPAENATQRNVLTKESILSLYSTSQPAPAVGAYGQAPVAPVGMPMQAIYGMVPGPGYMPPNTFLQGLASMPGGGMHLSQSQQPHVPLNSDGPVGEAHQFHSNPFLSNSYTSPVATQPANFHLPQLQQQMVGLQLGTANNAAWPPVMAGRLGASPYGVPANMATPWATLSTPAHQSHTLSTNLWQ